MAEERVDIKLRKNAREYAFLTLYSAMLNNADLDKSIAAEFVSEFDKEFADKLISVEVENDDEISELIREGVKNFSAAQLFNCDLVLIKIAVCEVNYLKATPKEIVINEIVNLAKKYSTQNSGKFINGVLASLLN